MRFFIGARLAFEPQRDVVVLIIATESADPIALNSLAAAYAEMGQFTQAVATARQALQKSDAMGMNDLSGQIRSYINSYIQGKPYRLS